jgi:hypothetical protein
MSNENPTSPRETFDKNEENIVRPIVENTVEGQATGRKRAMNEIKEKYQREHPNLAVEQGTRARKAKLEEIVSDLRTHLGEIDGGRRPLADREAVIKQLDMAEAAIKENEEILDVKLSFMDPADVLRIENMEQRKKEIGQEKMRNDAIIYGNDTVDISAKGMAAKENKELEKEEGALYIEKGQMFNQRYRGLDEI